MHYPVPVNGTGQSASPFWLPLPATEAARLLGKGGGKRFPSFLCLSSVYSVHSERLIRHVVLEQYRLPSQMAAADIALPITVLWGHLTNHNTTARKLFFPAAVAYGGRYVRAARDSARELCSSGARVRGRIFRASRQANSSSARRAKIFQGSSTDRSDPTARLCKFLGETQRRSVSRTQNYQISNEK